MNLIISYREALAMKKAGGISALWKSRSRSGWTMMGLLFPLVCGIALLNVPITRAQVFTLENRLVRCSVILNGRLIQSDRLEAQAEWAHTKKAGRPAVKTDADFMLEIMWTEWRGPGKQNNADNPISLSKKNFLVTGQESKELGDGTKELALLLTGVDFPLKVRLTYQLGANDFYVRRRVGVLDTSAADHFLRWFWPRYGRIQGVVSVVKAGDFGQPVALETNNGGAFFGLEYPASENRLQQPEKGISLIKCGQEIGEQIGKEWIESEWVVEAVTPDRYVKHWFSQYLDRIRVAPLRPYTLYNSWYDLRSPEYPRVPPGNIMSENTVLHIIDLIRKNMIDKHGISLDAFVLDDGWDLYKSDWVLRKEQFPNGLRLIADELRKTNTSLGLWFGPTGGYSFRSQRIQWMKDHGYEVVGDQLCVAGKNYSALLKKRVVDFVENGGVGYYKWDGIQFSCSEPDHGHPVDIYSRRAVLKSVIGMCRAVREKNPKMFLNITSGTWLSPWWLKYTNTIWMDGEDYGYSDVPSISQRDAAITYRDFVLYEDFKIKGLWFPIGNLMTHGIIKGVLEKLGGEEEPLDKFTDDALLYLARGVSMWELYISPDILTEGEWTAIAKSIAWAKDRFPILSSTEMIGGDPKKRETYGYAHFKEQRGIIAARNPFMLPSSLSVELAPSQGLDPGARSLVLERVYPTHWVSPRLYAAGQRVVLPLGGYETAIYEMYPVEQATAPLLAGAMVDMVSRTDSSCILRYYDNTATIKLLNPERVDFIMSNGTRVSPHKFSFRNLQQPAPVSGVSFKAKGTSDPSGSVVRFTVHESCREATLAVLLTPKSTPAGKLRPGVSVVLDGQNMGAVAEKQEGVSVWYKVRTTAGKHDASVRVVMNPGGTSWSGRAYLWLVCQQRLEANEVAMSMKSKVPDTPRPPSPWPPGEARRNIKLGEMEVRIGNTE